MKKKLALFPVTRNQCVLIRNESLLHGYDLVYLLVPCFWSLSGEDASCLDGGEIIGKTLFGFSKELLTDIDALYVDYNETLKNINLYKDVISSATGIGKEIILSYKMKRELANDELILPTDVNCNVENEKLYEIPCPVITVLTQGEHTDQFAVELSLRKYFTGIGYKVSQIGSHDSSYFFDFSGIPSFLYEPLDAYIKIVRFNHYVKEIVSQENPELLIIGVPDAIMRYSDRIPLGLGVLPGIICAAVKSDLGILCMYYSTYSKDSFEEISKYCYYHLRNTIHFFSIANTRVSSDNSEKQNKLEYFNLYSDFVMDGIKDLIKIIDRPDCYLFNALNNDSVDSACSLVQSFLTDNAEFVI